MKWPEKKLGDPRTFDEVMHSWLKDEWHFNHYDGIRSKVDSKIIEIPDFSSEEENKTRLNILKLVRKPMVEPLPTDTLWYSTSLGKAELDRTFIIPSSDWLPLTNNTYKLLEAVNRHKGSQLKVDSKRFN